MESYNGVEERVCTKKEEGVFVVKRRKGRGVSVYWWTIKEGIS